MRFSFLCKNLDFQFCYCADVKIVFFNILLQIFGKLKIKGGGRLQNRNQPKVNKMRDLHGLYEKLKAGCTVLIRRFL